MSTIYKAIIIPLFFFLTTLFSHSLNRTQVIKQQEEVRKKTTGKKLTSLFKLEDIDMDKVFKTRYHAFVTNQSLPANEIWEQYKLIKL